MWFDGRPDQSASVVTVAAKTITTVATARVATFGSATGQVVTLTGHQPRTLTLCGDLSGHYTGVGACTDRTGCDTLRGLPAGQYKIAFYPPGDGFEPVLYSEQGDELSATPITITGLKTTKRQEETIEDWPTRPARRSDQCGWLLGERCGAYELVGSGGW